MNHIFNFVWKWDFYYISLMVISKHYACSIMKSRWNTGMGFFRKCCSDFKSKELIQTQIYLVKNELRLNSNSKCITRIHSIQSHFLKRARLNKDFLLSFVLPSFFFIPAHINLPYVFWELYTGVPLVCENWHLKRNLKKRFFHSIITVILLSTFYWSKLWISVNFTNFHAHDVRYLAYILK